MKFIKGYKLISQEELSKLEADAEVRGAKESKQRIHISRPNLTAIAKAIRRAKEELGTFSLSSMCLVMGWDFYRELLKADNVYIRHGERYISILGCRLVVNDSGFVSYLEVEL